MTTAMPCCTRTGISPCYTIMTGYTSSDISQRLSLTKIIAASIKQSEPVKLIPAAEGMHVRFSYSVEWQQSDTKYEDRFSKYLDTDFFEQKVIAACCFMSLNSLQVHWLSILNSFVLVMFFVGAISLLLVRTVKADFDRYLKEEGIDLEKDFTDEYGWKQVHGDVFRSPSKIIVFAAFLGTGAQVAATAFAVIFFTIWRNLYTE